MAKLVKDGFDELEIRLGPRLPNGIHETMILINGQPLLDLVRAIERPLLSAELADRVAAGESPEDARVEPGDYLSPTAPEVASGEYFGPIEDYFRIDPDDKMAGKTVLLGCTCGDRGCWPLLVKITAEAGAVTWSEFEAGRRHRDRGDDRRISDCVRAARLSAAGRPITGAACTRRSTR